MKLKLIPALTIVYFLLVFFLLKSFNIFSLIFLAFVLILDYYTKIKSGILNLLYFLAALSLFQPLFYIFLIYLPFAIFGLLLEKRSFIKSYILGFAISFIPSTIVYLISTYLSVKLNFPIILIIFYLLPLIAIIVLNKKITEVLDFDNKDFIFALIVVFFTLIISINIVDDKNLFIANGAREFYRIQVAVRGLSESGSIPIYDPAIGTGEATYLWVTPTYITHFTLANLFLKFLNPILFFNAASLFILLLSVLSLGVLLNSIIDKEISYLNILVVIAITLITGLNFLFLQFLESIKAFYAYPIAHLLLSLVLINPKHFEDFFILLYLSALVLMIHSAVGLGVVLFALSLFFIVKAKYIVNKEEVKNFVKWVFANKIKILIIFIIMLFIPLFYVSTPSIFKDFLLDQPSIKLTFGNIKSAAIDFFKGYFGNELSYLSLRYPDVNRIDDHKFGLFLSVFGTVSLFLLIIPYKIKSIKNFRIFALGYVLHLILISLIYVVAFRVGGFFRTPAIYLLVLLGASILTIICLINKSLVKLVLVVAVFFAFLHMMPYARQSISNIHREQFMSGEIYKEEFEFIKKLPIDGRIMTYGLFSNVIDYGISYLTSHYGSRSERIELSIWRTPFEKIHGQNSFGEPELIFKKSGTELTNYMKLGGYKYLFVNVAHPIGNYVVSQVYPNYTYAIYYKEPFLLLAVNDTNYAEKIELAKDVSEETYKTKEGYKYTTISKYYDFNLNNVNFIENPKRPEALKFERLSPTKIMIYADFKDNDWVVFKEQYFLRWRAFMDNKEIPVFADNNELILIKTIRGKSILLEYSVLKTEKIIGTLSLVGFLCLALFLLYLLKQSTIKIR